MTKGACVPVCLCHGELPATAAGAALVHVRRVPVAPATVRLCAHASLPTLPRTGGQSALTGPLPVRPSRHLHTRRKAPVVALPLHR